MRRHIEPFWWALFSSGGTLAAFFLPVLIFIMGIAIPLGWIESPGYEKLSSLIRNLPVIVFLFSLMSLSL
ncbi:MAG: fumarate reductase subunit D, partial [Candidatus Marinimicrobia bacterium]|nr:fumarate reductase subunit D [Candidatus Neomarinimicrobiota bacterium]